MAYQDAYPGDPNLASNQARVTTSNVSKPAIPADWHPTTIPDSESPFRLAYCLPQHEYTLFREGNCRDLPCYVLPDEVRLGCTYIDNTAIREMYWWSNASPGWLRWVVRMWDAWKRKGS